MAVFRVEKSTNYTVMSNYHLHDRRLSLKAKGLLSQMLSLPDDWDYTLAGLATINLESKDAIRAAVNELEQAGYITRRRTTDAQGKFGANEYIIRESPLSAHPSLENPMMEKPTLENPSLENPTQLSTKATNIEKKNEKRKGDQLSIEDMRQLFRAWIAEVVPDYCTDDVKAAVYNALDAYYNPSRELTRGKPPRRTADGFAAVCKDLKGWSKGVPAVMISILADAVANKRAKIKAPSGSDSLTDKELNAAFVEWINSVSSNWSRESKNAIWTLLVSFYDPTRKIKRGDPPVRSQKGFDLMSKHLRDWSKGNPLVMQDILETAIANGWTGIHPPNGGSTNTPPVQKPSGRYYEEL